MAVVLCTKGKEIIASRLADLLSVPKYLGVGTGAGSAAVGDTTLFSETGTRAICALSLETTDTANDTMKFLGTITNFDALKTITNAGLFDALTGGNLLAKADSIGQVLDTNEGLTVSFSVKITGAC